MSATSKILWNRSSLTSLVACVDFHGRVWVPREAPSNVTITSPESVLSSRAAGILGENGVSRFVEFWTYQEGWYFGEGQPLALASLAQMEHFLAVFDSFGSEPSLFLTRGGNLLLGWEDEGGEVVEVEFGSEGYVIFLGATDTEIRLGLQDKDHLMRLLPRSPAGDGAR